MTAAEQRQAAKRFAEYWEGKGYEKGQSQPFWLSLLRDVYGIEHPEQYILFEEQVHLDNTSFIDGSIATTHVLIEQKSVNKDLNAPIKQTNGTKLTPFQQAKRYAAELPYSQRPRWIVTCNFKEFCIYDMERPSGDPEILKLSDLEKEYYRLQFLIDTGNENIKKEMEISLKAGELVGILYDGLLKQYKNPDDSETLKSLNALCVRLVFCLYAEDAEIFGGHNKFHDYLQKHRNEDRSALINLFIALDTKPEERDQYMAEDLAAFPYVNGGLFADENIEIPRLGDEIIDLILNNASADFNWSDISPTIFGAVFESTLNPETRRSGGMHYTSIENIHKVIDSLFLDSLKTEFSDIMSISVTKTRNAKLQAFQNKLAALKFLDPACGSGNFLTETYLSLRRLENKTIAAVIEATKGQVGGQVMLDYGNPIKVSIGQFYGIEINDFAVKVAKTALWIAESQMMEETEDVVKMTLDFLPLKSYENNIVEGNALCLNWVNIIPKQKLSFIMGNPPFVGARVMNNEQKADLLDIFGSKWANSGNLDYVCCWFKKATEIMQGTSIHTAFVSTNSITQGELVANLWQPLFENGVHIDFAHRTFQWDSDAKIRAHVHCVIIGFSMTPIQTQKLIFSSGRLEKVENINAYLVDADDIFVKSRTKPICNVPKLGIGNQPIDGGYYLFTKEEKDDFINKEPRSAIYFHPWIGAEEFINGYKRYCLWLGNCAPNELRLMPLCLERIRLVKAFRSESKRASTLKLANTPTKFQVENFPNGDYIVIPEISSDKRRYIPIGFMSPAVMCSNRVKVSQNATLYNFGVLTSNVHMAWVRTVCGRLETRFCYSINVVYNNYPWPEPSATQRVIIEKTAQKILDARSLYPECSLADLYDELTMPSELRKAHQDNDRAVMEAYRFWGRLNTESECVAELMKMYQSLVAEK